jgi:hypothetical protein
VAAFCQQTSSEYKLPDYVPEKNQSNELDAWET